MWLGTTRQNERQFGGGDREEVKAIWRTEGARLNMYGGGGVTACRFLTSSSRPWLGCMLGKGGRDMMWDMSFFSVTFLDEVWVI